MSTVFLSNLKAAHESGKPIELMTGKRSYWGIVEDVNEEADFVVLLTPQAMGDKATMTTIAMANIASVGRPLNAA
jgi:hypothetical protein